MRNGIERTISIVLTLLLITGAAYAISSVDQGFQAGWFVGDIANGTVSGNSVSSLISSLAENDTVDRTYVNTTFLPISTYNGDYPNSSLTNYILISTYSGDFPNSTLSGYNGDFPNSSLTNYLLITTYSGDYPNSSLANYLLTSDFQINFNTSFHTEIPICTSGQKLNSTDGETIICDTDATGEAGGNVSSVTAESPLTYTGTTDVIIKDERTTYPNSTLSSKEAIWDTVTGKTTLNEVNSSAQISISQVTDLQGQQDAQNTSLTTHESDKTSIHSFDSEGLLTDMPAVNKSQLIAYGASGEGGSVYATSTGRLYLCSNAFYNGTWNRINVASQANLLSIGAFGNIRRYSASAGANPISSWDILDGVIIVDTTGKNPLNEPVITGSTNNVFWNGLKQWIALGIGNITNLQTVLDAMNTSSATNNTASITRDDVINSTKVNKTDASELSGGTLAIARLDDDIVFRSIHGTIYNASGAIATGMLPQIWNVEINGTVETLSLQNGLADGNINISVLKASAAIPAYTDYADSIEITAGNSASKVTSIPIVYGDRLKFYVETNAGEVNSTSISLRIRAT